ncbi:hypothetical protein NVV95_03375 [Herbiconiux sp. CPCC 205716]|uniref:Uncharacterized protein n=1 Tax=Herbiconiux gentiana TaxID=2970912 RepID=A0ABT2GBL3_9MICO|nr:hypothetical protein [Herbiconiux gentiana]MCS5713593.1 hypothetical protein [Herbiconiux gentiana]
MLTIPARTLRLVAAHWPALLAWYLAGWLARYLIIELASYFGATSALIGLLILPLAALARLGSFIAMFLVLRPSMPSFQELRRSGRGTEEPGAPETGRRRVTEIVLTSILPFFTFYAAWQFLSVDVQQYATGSLENIDPFQSGVDRSAAVLNVRLDVWSIGVIVVAFAGRTLLKRYRVKLPAWSSVIAVYCEAVWIYVALYFINSYLGQFSSWVSSRAAVQWYETVKAAAFEAVHPIGVAWAAVEWAIGRTGGLVLLPLAWLTLAGIVYGRALAAPKITYRPKNAYYTSARKRIDGLPGQLRRRLAELGDGVTGRFKPTVSAFLLIWRAGAAPMGLFVLGYTVIEAGSSWLLLAGVRLIGPHDLHAWWMNFDDMLVFVVGVIVEPLRLCLIAAAYDFCLRRLEERREAAEGTGRSDATEQAGTVATA